MSLKLSVKKSLKKINSSSNSKKTISSSSKLQIEKLEDNKEKEMEKMNGFVATNSSLEEISSETNTNERSKIPLKKKSLLTTNGSKNSLISKYNLKLNQLILMKKDLAEKQKPVIDLYKSVLSLRKEISKSQGKIIPTEQLKILSYPLEDQFLQSKGDNPESSDTGNEIIKLKNRFQNFLNFFIELCHNLSNKKCKIFDKLFNEEFEINETNIKMKLDECREELRNLDEYTEKEMHRAEKAIQVLLCDAQFLMMQGNSQTETPQELETKLQCCEERLKEALTYLEMQQIDKEEENVKAKSKKDDVEKITIQLKDMQKIYEEERELVSKFQKRQDWYEETLKATKEEVRNTRLKKQELESKVGELQNYVKKMENEWKFRETALCERFNNLSNAFQIQELYIRKLETHSRKRNLKLLFTITLHIMYDILYPEIYFIQP